MKIMSDDVMFFPATLPKMNSVKGVSLKFET